jgi:hypothetical protein
MNAPLGETGQMMVTLREVRLILERLVQVAGVPPGLLPSVRDCAVYSAALPGPGFSDMSQRIARLGECRPTALTIVAETPHPIVDAHGQHAWYVAHSLLDLAIERFLTTGHGEATAVNVAEPAELRVVAGLAEAHGLDAELLVRRDGMVVRVTARPADAQMLLDRIRRGGVPIVPSIWWQLYQDSHAALAPDSFESRRHAGTIRVEADGRVVGRHDEDETDLSMLAADPSRLRLTPASSPS